MRIKYVNGLCCAWLLALGRAGLMSFCGGESNTLIWVYLLPVMMPISQWNDKSCQGFHTFFLFYFSHGRCVVTRTPEDNEASSWATIASNIFLLQSHSLDQHRLLCPVSSCTHSSSLCRSNSSPWAGFWKLHLWGSLWAIKLSSVVFNTGIRERRKCN